MKQFHRLNALLLVLCLCVSLIPGNTFAAVLDQPQKTVGAAIGDMEYVGEPAAAPQPLESGAGKRSQAEDDIVLLPNAADNERTRYSVLVLDTSDSTSFSYNGITIYKADTAIADVKVASKKFIESVQKADGTNYVALVEYKGDESRVVTNFTTDYQVLNAAVDGLYNDEAIRSVAYGLETATTLLEGITDPDAIKNVVIFTTGMTNTGSYNYTGLYDDNTVGSGWRRNDTQVYLYAYSNSAIEQAEILKENATLYSVGLFQSMEDMPSQGQDIVSFFKMFTKDLASGEQYFYDVNDPSQLEFVFGEVADDITRKVSGTTYFPSMGDNDKDYPITYFYDDQYFAGSAKEYINSLATMSLCFELSAFASNETDDYTRKSQNAQKLLTECGFQDFDTNPGYESKPTMDSIGVVAAHKKIEIDGVAYTLIAAATRGGGYEAEWGGNFEIGVFGRHQGFERARKQTYEFLEQYIRDNKENFASTTNVKLWLTGFSRGAATINLTAADIVQNGGIGGLSFDENNVYAYCFETPMGMQTYQEGGEVYENIHNIVNPNDLVTKVAMEDWGFGRFGTDEQVIPSRLTTSNKDIFDKMLAQFKKLNTSGTKQSIVHVGGGACGDDCTQDRHIIDTFQAKKLDPNLVDFGGHWDTVNIWPFGEISYWNIDTDWNPRLISNSTTSMEVFLDRLVTAISVGIGNRIHYTDKLQNTVRLATAEFMGGGFESAKWEKLPDLLSQSLSDNQLELAYAYVTGGESGVTAVVARCLGESIRKADIDLVAYADICPSIPVFLVDVVEAIVASLFISGGNDLITLCANFKEAFGFHAHYPELCLAWLQIQDPNYTKDGQTLFFIDAYRVIHINCPVDVAVYDGSGRLVAHIVDDVPQELEDGVYAEFSEDGEKLVYLPADMSYSVELTATGDGTLHYSVREYSYSVNGNVKLMSYAPIEITTGDTLWAFAGSFDEADSEDTSCGSQNTLYHLEDQDGFILKPETDLSGEEAQAAVYVVQVSAAEGCENGGYISGGGAYTLDSFAQAGAYPYDGCTFEGWYIGDVLVSTEAEYRFQVKEDTDLTARFSGSRPAPPTVNPFLDVPSDAFYYEPVLWAVENGITTGVTEDLFNPAGQCMRAMVVTFLWRAAGEPEPISKSNPFVDVDESEFFYKPVLWAVENGITNGMDATHFAPYDMCNRAQVVTFLWRAMGEPASDAEAGFSDVENGKFYTEAVQWAVEQNITNGMGDGTFGIGRICNRAQVVTFLYRTYET